MMVRGFLRSHAIQFLVLLTMLAAPAGDVRAQDQDQPPEHHHPEASTSEEGWAWNADANAFYGYNYQKRKFADFWAWESQNWMMLAGERPIGPGRLTVQGMLSLEPFTIAALGSPQVFQTGESYQGAPLINLQHPHDLVLGLGATYRVAHHGVTYIVGADLVGSPALGPTPFMHRESARDNPQVPLTHHYMDSTHITSGVLRAGVEFGQMTFETSAFRGEEPDEHRLNIDQPRLDSWSARTSWHRGPWQAQFSGGHLHEPEWFEPVDVTRLTASIGFNGTVLSRPLTAMVGWGQNREPAINIALDGYLAEWDLKLTSANTVYGRAESVLKEIFGLGVHPRGLLNHPRNFSQINALTLGYVRDIPVMSRMRIGLGTDMTVYRTSEDLREYFGSPHSFHVFVRWRPERTAPAHVH
jgi:hypothetical protein